MGLRNQIEGRDRRFTWRDRRAQYLYRFALHLHDETSEETRATRSDVAVYTSSAGVYEMSRSSGFLHREKFSLTNLK